ncbi:MAG TPA: toll/interleukin-1 receptor domain-containing protein, partial [Hyphomonas sp.]|nr:toll/interleukin-1 receptor domain-containing protein [Hyphomonas sp.]
RQNGAIVYPLVEEVEAAGRSVWIDRDAIEAGGNWAGMIVRAIRESETFCLMCSAEAFQSDNVRREIYIADKYKRKLLPVRLDSAEMPEDFEYFLIDRQWLDLTGIAPAERASRLTALLAR